MASRAKVAAATAIERCWERVARGVVPPRARQLAHARHLELQQVVLVRIHVHRPHLPHVMHEGVEHVVPARGDGGKDGGGAGQADGGSGVGR